MLRTWMGYGLGSIVCSLGILLFSVDLPKVQAAEIKNNAEQILAPEIFKDKLVNTVNAAVTPLVHINYKVVELNLPEKSEAVSPTALAAPLDTLLPNGLSGMSIVAILQGKVVEVGMCLNRRNCALNVETDLLKALLHRDKGAAVFLVSPDYQVAKNATVSSEALSSLTLKEPTFELVSSLISTKVLNASSEEILLPLSYPEVVEEVKCKKARCSLSPEGIEVYGIEGNTLAIGVQLTFKKNINRKINGQNVKTETLEVPIERCGLRLPTGVPLLAGATDHRYFVGIARKCFVDKAEDLAVETFPPSMAFVKGEVIPEGTAADNVWRYFEIDFARVPERISALKLTFKHKAPNEVVLSMATIPVITDYLPLQVNLSLPKLGAIDFIPSNVLAKVEMTFADTALESSIFLEPKNGFYAVEQDPLTKSKQIKAVTGARGNIPLNLVYAPEKFITFLGRKEVLAKLETDSLFAIKQVNIPLVLNPRDKDSPGFVRVYCRRHGERVEAIAGESFSIPYKERQTCKLEINRELIPKSAGEQRLRIDTPYLHEIIRVSYALGKIVISLSKGEEKEFDALSVAIGHEYSGGHYNFSPEHNLGTEVNYRIIMGDRKVRISIGTALPTGLFRFGPVKERGSVPFSAGGVARLAWLYKEGVEFPLGLDFGVLGTGLSSDKPQLSLVMGLGFRVPVLNANTVMQTAFSLHAWLEYSPTRTAAGESRMAFLFGPSFGLGNFATNL